MADMVARLTRRCRARSTWMMPGQPSTSQRMAICFWVSFRPGKWAWKCDLIAVLARLMWKPISC